MNPESGRHPKRRKRIGEILVESGLIDESILAKALEIQKIKKKKLGQILTDMGVADDETIAKTLSSQLNIPLVHLKGLEIPEEVLSLVPPEMVENYLLINLLESEDYLVLTAKNGLEALKLVIKERPDLVITDFLMPEMDGLASRQRRSKSTAKASQAEKKGWG